MFPLRMNIWFTPLSSEIPCLSEDIFFKSFAEFYFMCLNILLARLYIN